VRLKANDKECVTFLASVTAKGTRLPLTAIARGKTAQVETSQLGSHEALVRDHAKSGRTTIVTFCHYLEWLSDYIDSRRPGPRPEIRLILDCYPVHRSRERPTVRRQPRNQALVYSGRSHRHASTLGSSCLRGHQSDVSAIIRIVTAQNTRGKVTKGDAMHISSKIWRDLSIDAIHAGWAIYDDDFGPEEDDDDDPE
jgi:hypothetical protein